MTNNYKVFTLKLARKLCELGFKVVGTAPNAQKPWLNVYLFEDTQELREAIEKYKGQSSLLEDNCHGRQKKKS